MRHLLTRKHPRFTAYGKRMIANYGCEDGSGRWYLILNTDRCNGCGDCVRACPCGVLDVGPDEVDIFREEPVAFVREEERKKLRYTCAPCRPGEGGRPTPCVAACQAGAISHAMGSGPKAGIARPRPI